MVTEPSTFVHQNSGTIFQFTLDRPNACQVLNLNLKLTYLIIVSLIIFKFCFSKFISFSKSFNMVLQFSFLSF